MIIRMHLYVDLYVLQDPLKFGVSEKNKGLVVKYE